MAKKVDYSQAKIIAWRYLRVFLATFLTTLGLGLIGVGDFNALRSLVTAGLSAGLVATAKALRDEYGGTDLTSLIHKIPF